MTVFVAASDETSGADERGWFVHAGFVAPEADWSDWFTPAWKERVLDGPPAIPFLHLAAIRRPEEQARYGLSSRQADERIAEAVRIVSSLGSLYLVSSMLEVPHFAAQFASARLIKRVEPQPAVGEFKPDYLPFLGFAIVVLQYVSHAHPEAQQVKFVVEHKQGVTPLIEDFYQGLQRNLANSGLKHLIPLIGELVPASKDCIPLQAADLFCWHLQRVNSARCDEIDRTRCRKLMQRPGSLHRWTREEIEGMAARARDQSEPNPFAS